VKITYIECIYDQQQTSAEAKWI